MARTKAPTSMKDIDIDNQNAAADTTANADSDIKLPPKEDSVELWKINLTKWNNIMPDWMHVIVEDAFEITMCDHTKNWIRTSVKDLALRYDTEVTLTL